MLQHKLITSINTHEYTLTQEYQLRNTHMLGRDKKCDIRINHPTVSRRHATIVKLVDGYEYHYYITDGFNGIPSTFGLYLNGMKIHSQQLKHNDRIVFAHNDNLEISAIYSIIGDEDEDTFKRTIRFNSV